MANPNSIRNKAIEYTNKQKRDRDQNDEMRKSFYAVRNDRQGYRGGGLFQLARYYSSQGVLTIDGGGPRVVGR